MNKRDKKGKFVQGNIPPFKGKKMSQEIRKKMSLSKINLKPIIIQCLGCENLIKTKSRKRFWCDFCKRRLKSKYDKERGILKRDYLLEKKKIYRENHKEEIKKSNKKHIILGGEKRKKYISKWKKDNKDKLKRYPEKEKSRRIAREKIKIPLGTLCEKCLKNKAKERHHEDYNKPLDVLLLCVKCHAEVTWNN